MSTLVTWGAKNLAFVEPSEIESSDNRRSEARVTPPWHIQIEIDDCVRVSTPIADLSIKAFRIDVPEILDNDARVRFSIFENANEYLGGQTLMGEATVLLNHAKGTVFEFQNFDENDFNRFCDALLKILIHSEPGSD